MKSFPVMKQIGLLVILTVTIILMMSVGASAANETILNSNFNGANPLTGWTIPGSGGTGVTVADAGPSGTGDTAFKITNTNSSAYNVAKSFNLQSGSFIFEADFKVDTNDTTSTNYIWAYDSALNVVVRVQYSASTSKLSYFNGASGVTGPSFSKGEWNKIKFVIDTPSNTYDLYLNGILVQAGMNLYTTSTYPIYRFGLDCRSTHANGTLYDNISIYKSISGNVIYDNFNSGQIGAWSANTNVDANAGIAGTGDGAIKVVNTTGLTTISRTFNSQTDIAVIEFDMYREAGEFYIGAYDASNRKAINVRFKTDGNININEGGVASVNVAYLALGTRHNKIKLIINVKDKKFDLYFNRVLARANNSFDNANATDISKIEFIGSYTNANGVIIDNVAVFKKNSYFVDTANGDDTRTGAQAQNISTPWKTIQRAADFLTAGDTCYIRGGTYRENVTPANNGNSEYPITFRNYASETVIINGTDVVQGWTLDSGSVYKSSITLNLGDNNQIFQDGVMLHEARWPNNNGTLLQPTLNTVDSGSATTITDTDFSQPDGYWNGAKVWCVHGIEYTSSIQTVSNYDASTKTITFDSFPGPSYYAPKEGNKYYLFGIKSALDNANEFYYSNSYLYVYGNPGSSVIEAKKRYYGLNLTGRSYINIFGIGLFATGIITDDDTNNCTLDGVNGQYLGHGNYSVGIWLKGVHNTLKNSNLNYASSKMIDVQGSNNRVINCLIQNGNYDGNWSALLNIRGNNHLISHNTIQNAGRGCIAVERAKEIQIQYNKVSGAMYLTKDGGVIVSGNMDHMNSRYHHNLIYDNKDTVNGGGIYFDCYSENAIVDHNVIWGCTVGLVLNTPSNNMLIYNNTFNGSSNGMTHFGVYYADDLFQCRLFNNIFNNTVMPSGGSVWGNNIYSSTNPMFVDVANNNYRLQSSSPAINAGVVIPGITDGYITSPDCGAYEYSGNDWTAGHNFDLPPSPAYDTPTASFMNLIDNGGFELTVLTGWAKTGNQTAAVSQGNAWSNPNDIVKNNYAGVRLGGGIDGIEQTITGLNSNTTYILSGWTKTEPNEVVNIGVKNYGGNDIYNEVRSHLWTKRIIEFTTGASNTSATIYLNKTSSGSGYVYGDQFMLTIKDESTSHISFENSMDGFSGTDYRTTDKAHHGSYSYKVYQDNQYTSISLPAKHNKILTLWFYDDASDTDSQVIADVNDNTSTRALGVNTNISTNMYTYRTDGASTATTVPRTTGWHEFKWDYSSGDNVKMYIDGKLVATATGIIAFSKISLGDFWADGKISTVYFDDITIHDYYAQEVANIAMNQYVGTFENGLTAWGSDQTPTFSSQQKHGGVQSYFIDSDVDYATIVYPEQQSKVVRIWFYDSGSTNMQCFARVDDNISSRMIGVNPSVSTTNYVVRVENTSSVSNIVRSTGWHELSFDYTSGTKVDMYIDGNLVASPSGVITFNVIRVGDWWADSRISNAYFDDITIN